MRSAEAIRIRINLLRARGTDNGAIIKKLERKLRALERAAQ